MLICVNLHTKNVTDHTWLKQRISILNTLKRNIVCHWLLQQLNMHIKCVFGHTKRVVLACCVSMSSPLSLRSYGGSHIIFAAPCTSSVPPTLTSPFLVLISPPRQWTDFPNLQIIICDTLHWHALPWARTAIIKFYINCCIHHYDVINNN